MHKLQKPLSILLLLQHFLPGLVSYTVLSTGRVFEVQECETGQVVVEDGAKTHSVLVECDCGRGMGYLATIGDYIREGSY